MLAQFNQVPPGVPDCVAAKNRSADDDPRAQHSGLGDLLSSSADP
jgi:hypothetical protein